MSSAVEVKHRRSLTSYLFSSDGWAYLLVPFIPLAVALDLANLPSAAVFFASAIGIIPTAALMGQATEELATRAGPGIGGLLNVTFGNAPELIIALFALGAGLQEVVKASLVGSILGNVLLVMGGAMFVGGIGRARQQFNRTVATSQASMLLLAGAALAMPAVYSLVVGNGLPQPTNSLADFGATVQSLSLVVAIVLIISYLGGLVFSLRTHRALFNPPAEEAEEDEKAWTVRRSIVMLAVAGVAVAVMSEVLVDSITPAAKSLGLSQFFIGVIVIAIVGNAAEHWVALLFAAKNKMDMAINIAIGSSAQIALFVAPVLVIVSFFLGPRPMALVFNGFELGAFLLAVLIANHTTSKGESTWFDGLQLLAVYAVFAAAFFFA